MDCISVIEPAMVSSNTPSKVSVNFGAPISIECLASGRPLPSLSWYKDGAELNTSGPISITRNAVNSTHIDSVLTVSSVTYDDEAVYTCTATNILPNGMVTHSVNITLKVLCKCKLKSMHVSQLHNYPSLHFSSIIGV